MSDAMISLNNIVINSSQIKQVSLQFQDIFYFWFCGIVRDIFYNLPRL